MSNEIKPAVIACDVFWAFTNKPNQLSGKYQVDLCNLSDKAVEALEEFGLPVKNNPNKPDQGKYITATSELVIKPTNPAGDLLTGIEIGNGSKARAVVTYYDWNFNGKKGRSPSLHKLIIDDLVEYTGGAADVGGYDLNEAI